jgi:signal transduction histidine kinase
MKPIYALIVAALAGAGTFELQNTIVAPQAHAAGFQLPTGPDWRQQMIARDRGTEGVDHSLVILSRTLGLTADQARRVRPMLQQRHDRILALLLKGPPSLTLDEFMTQRYRISADMHDHVDTVLTIKQLQQEAALHMPGHA